MSAVVTRVASVSSSPALLTGGLTSTGATVQKTNPMAAQAFVRGHVHPCDHSLRPNLSNTPIVPPVTAPAAQPAAGNMRANTPDMQASEEVISHPKPRANVASAAPSPTNAPIAAPMANPGTVITTQRTAPGTNARSTRYCANSTGAPKENPTDTCQRGEERRLCRPLSLATALLTTSAKPPPTPSPSAVARTHTHRRLLSTVRSICASY